MNFGLITSSEMPTKLNFIHTRFKFINFINNTYFLDTDQTQTKNINFNHKFFKNKSQSHQTCQVHNNNLNYFGFRIYSYFNRVKKIGYRFTDFGTINNPVFFFQKPYQILAENEKEKNGKMDEYEQSFGYWQQFNNQNESGNPKNKTNFYGFGKTQNINDVIQNEQFTDVNFVFLILNNIPQYTCAIYSIKVVLKTNF